MCIDKKSLTGYTATKYCPIQPGSVLVDQYTAKVKLGYGRISTMWLFKEDSSDAYKVCKFGTIAELSREKNVLEQLKVAATHSDNPGKYCVRRLEHDFNFSLGGRAWQGLAFEPLGMSLLEYSNRRERLGHPLGSHEVRFITMYLLHALDFMHSNIFTHTDIKLDNIQLTLPEDEDSFLNAFCEANSQPSRFHDSLNDGTQVFASHTMQQENFGFPILCDLGSVISADEQYDEVVQALPYRAPEVILGAHWDHRVDLWNLGVLIWELLFGEHLFSDLDEPTSIKLMVQYLGDPPLRFLAQCRKATDFFDSQGKWKHGNVQVVSLEDRVEADTAVSEMFDFLRCLLRWDPRERVVAQELLDHSWLRAIR